MHRKIMMKCLGASLLERYHEKAWQNDWVVTPCYLSHMHPACSKSIAPLIEIERLVHATLLNYAAVNLAFTMQINTFFSMGVNVGVFMTWSWLFGFLKKFRYWWYFGSLQLGCHLVRGWWDFRNVIIWIKIVSVYEVTVLNLYCAILYRYRKCTGFL